MATSKQIHFFDGIPYEVSEEEAKKGWRPLLWDSPNNKIKIGKVINYPNKVKKEEK